MIAHKNLAKDAGRLLFWFPLRWCVLLMPFPLIFGLGKILGYLDYYLSGKQSIERMKQNMKKTFGYSDARAGRTVIKSLQFHIHNVLEMIKYCQIHEDNMSDLIEFQGLERLDQELEKGCGVVLMTAHYGAKQMLQMGLGLKGYPLTQIHYHMQKEELTWIQKNVSQKYRKKIEEKIPVNFVSSQGFLVSAVKSLKKNQILLIAGDGIGIKKYMDKGYRSFPFLGRSMLFPTGGAAIARMAKSSILPVFAVRKKHRHTIVIGPAIDQSRGDDEALRQYIKSLENYIRAEPALWEFWEEFEEGLLIEAD